MRRARELLRRVPRGLPTVVVLSALIALLVAYKPSLAPVGLHPRGMELGVAQGQILVDTPTSHLLDVDQDNYGPGNFALTYALYLQTDGAKTAIMRNAGLAGRRLAASGPFTQLVGRSNIVRAVPVQPIGIKDTDFRLVLDVTDYRPVLTIFAQAPTESAATAIVRATERTLSDAVGQRQRALLPPEPSRSVLRVLGEPRSGTVSAGVHFQLSLFVFVLLSTLGFVFLRRRELRRRLVAAVGRRALRPAPVQEPRVPASDDWPNTRRLLPWALAGFVFMVMLIPFDAITLPIPIPMDGKLDRPVLLGLILLWLATLVAVTGAARPRVRLTSVHLAALVFFSFCCLGAVLNAPALLNLDEFALVVKKLALLGSFIAFFVIVASVVRPREVPRFAVYMVVLGLIAAVGAIWEYRLHFNPFYTWSEKLIPGSIALPGDLYGRDSIGRLAVYGSTGHPLELATMLGMMVPFAMLGFMDSATRRRRILYGIAVALLFAGALATVRKTSIVAPAAGILLLLAYRPRLVFRRMLPLSVPLGAIIHFVAPGTLGSVLSQLSPLKLTGVRTTQDRTADYDAVRPDVISHLFFGRGYQSYDGHKYRILDNEYLGLIIGVGLIGLLCYLAILIASLRAAHTTIRRDDPVRGRYALAGAGAIAVVGVATLLFDDLSFPHVPYLMFFVAGLLVALREPSPAEEPEGARTRPPPLRSALIPRGLRLPLPREALGLTRASSTTDRG